MKKFLDKIWAFLLAYGEYRAKNINKIKYGMY